MVAQTSFREQALQLFRKNPFFACWNPASLDIFIECAICNDEDGGVRLKMSKFLVCHRFSAVFVSLKHRIQETAVFTERRASFEVWDLLPELDERVELRYVMPGNLNYARLVWFLHRASGSSRNCLACIGRDRSSCICGHRMYQTLSSLAPIIWSGLY